MVLLAKFLHSISQIRSSESRAYKLEDTLAPGWVTCARIINVAPPPPSGN